MANTKWSDFAPSEAVSAIGRVADESGIDPAYLMGLAKLETRVGSKSIRSGDDDTRNLFNIKDFSGGGIRAVDKAEGSNDAYRQYASYDESARDLVDLLERKFPAALNAKSPEEFAAALKKGGYATDPDYASKLASVIEGAAGPVKPPVNWDDFKPVDEAAANVNWDDFKPVAEQPAKPIEKPGFIASAIDSIGTGMNAVRDFATGATPARTSVLEGLPVPELPFDPQEAERLSNRAYAERTPIPGETKRTLPTMRPSTGPDRISTATSLGESLQDMPSPVRALAKAGSGMLQGVGGVARAVGDVTGLDSLARGGALTTKQGNEFDKAIGDTGPIEGFGPKSPAPYLVDMAEGAASSLAQSAAMAAAFGPGAVIPLMSIQTAGQEYDKARTQGLSPAMALAGAVPKGVFEAVGEKFTGLDKAASAMGTLLQKGASDSAKRTAGEVLIHAGIREIPGEVITYLGQTGTDLIPGIGLNPDLTMGQFLDGMRDTVVQAGMMGGAMAGGGHAVHTKAPAAMPSAQDMIRKHWGEGFTAPAKPDPIAAIGQATTVDEAIAAATAAVQSAPGESVAAVDNIEALLKSATPAPAESLPAAVTNPDIQQLHQRIAELENANARQTPVEPAPDAIPAPAPAPAELPGADGTQSGAPVAAQPAEAALNEAAPPQAAPQAAPAQAPATGRVEATGPAAARTEAGASGLEAAGVAQPAATLNSNGTLNIKGDPATITAQLRDAGLTGIRTKDGVQVGKSQAVKAQSIFQQDAPQVQAAPPQAATENVAPSGPQQLGRDNQPLSEGGKPFKTRLAAADAKKLQPMMRVVAVKGGFALADKTPKQLAAEAKAARRLSNPQTSPPGEPIPAHAFIAAEGGLHADTRADMNVGGNPRIGNRTLFGGAGKGLTMERATARLIEEGYLGEGAGHSEAMALIKRSLTQPQYNADGYERIAEAETQARFDDYLQAEHEEPSPELQDEDAAFLALRGYTEPTAQELEEINTLMQIAEAEGIDTEIALLHAEQVEEQVNTQDYAHDHAEIEAGEHQPTGSSSRAETEGRRAEPGRPATEPASNRNGQPADRQEGAGKGAPAEVAASPAARMAVRRFEETLAAVERSKSNGGIDPVTGSTTDRLESQAVEQQGIAEISSATTPEQKAEAVKAADARKSEFRTKKADRIEAAGGSKEIVNSLRETVTQATAILDAARVTGKDRLDILRDIKKGDITPDEVEAAYPAKSEAPGKSDVNIGRTWFDGVEERKVLGKLDDGRYVVSGRRIAADDAADGQYTHTANTVHTGAELEQLISREQGSGQSGFSLESPTKEAILERDKRMAQADKADAKAATDAENKARADASRNEFALTGSDRAADVGAAGGQEAMFSRTPDRPDRQAFEPLANQSTARTLNDTLVNYGLGQDWSHAYEAVKLPDALSGVRQALQTAFGRDVRAVAPTADKFNIFNGVYIPSQPRAVYVNVAADVGFVNIAGHELWHTIKRQRPDLIDWYREHSRQFYKDLPAYRDRLNNLLQEGERKYSATKAEEELEADFMGDSLADPQFLQQLADASPSKFKALLAHVRLWLSGVANKLKGLGSTQEVNDVKALQGYLKEVLVAFAEGRELPIPPQNIAPRMPENATDDFGMWRGKSGNKWPADGAKPMVLFHNGNGADVFEVLSENPDALVDFGGIFAGPNAGMGGDKRYSVILDESKGLTNYDFKYEIDYNKAIEELKKDYPDGLTADDAEFLWDFVSEDRFHNDSDILNDEDQVDASRLEGLVSMSNSYRKTDFSMDYAVQRLRGLVAKGLGYQWVEMTDETGASTLILPGVEVRVLKGDETFNEAEARLDDEWKSDISSREMQNAPMPENANQTSDQRNELAREYMEFRKTDPARAKAAFQAMSAIDAEARRAADAQEALKPKAQETYKGEHEAPMHDSGKPLHDLTDAYPADFYGPKGPEWYGVGDGSDARAMAIVRALKGRPGAPVEVYRAIPKDVTAKIGKGDWVTIDRQYAKDHGDGALNGNYKIIRKTVRADELFTNGDSIQEWGYDPKKLRDEPAMQKESQSFSRATNETRTGNQGGRSADDSTPGAAKKKALLTKSEFDAAVEFVKKIESLAEKHGAVYVRWSSSEKHDLSEGAKSKDAGSGEIHAGLSSQKIDADMHPVTIARRIAEYGFARGFSNSATYPRIYIADEVGTDSDNAVSITNLKKVVDVPKSFVDAIDKRFADAFDAMDDIQRESKKLEQYPGHHAITERLEAAKARLEKIQPNESTAPDSDGAPMFARSPAAGPGLFQPTIWNTPGTNMSAYGLVDIDKFIYRMQDNRIDLKRAQEAILASGQVIEEKFDARLSETLYMGRVAERSRSFRANEGGSLLQSMALNKVTMAELSDYLHARGAEERNKQIAKVNPAMPDGGAGTNSQGTLLTTQAARDYLAAIPATRLAALTATARKVDAITAGTRQLLVAEGLEKQETIDAWEGAYKHYVPMFRDEAESGAPPQHPQGSGFTIKGGSSKRATGSTKEVTNMISHVLMQREAAITRAEKNHVAMSLYGLALSSPNPEFWTTIKPGMSAAQIGAELVAMGVDPMTAQIGMEGAPTIRTVDPVTNKVVDRANPMYKTLPGAITLRVAGEDRVLMLNVKNERALRMAESLKNLDGLTNLDIAGNIIGKSTRWIASVNTQYNPAFGVVNFVRDTLGGAVNLSSTPLRGKTMAVLGHVPAAMTGIARELASPGSAGQWQALYRQFREDGGQTGFKENFRDPNERTKAIEKELAKFQNEGRLTAGKAAHAVLNLLDGFNTSMENAVRLSSYKTALDSGMSRKESARLARELTVDFNRKGQVGRELGPLYAFFNAAVQSNARTLVALKGPAGTKIIAGGLALGMVQALMLAAAGYDDDELKEFEKTRSLVIPTNWSGQGKKTHIMIPYPLGLHVLPNTGRVIAELTLNGGKDIGKRTFNAVGAIASAMNPLGGGNVFTMHGALTTALPTVLDPAADVASNKNFSENDIERKPFNEEGDNRPGWARAREATQRSATGQVYLGISKAINAMTGGNAYEAGLASPTPEMVRYLGQVVGGGVLRELEKAVDGSVKVATGEKVKPNAFPMFSRFYGEVDGDSVETSRYYEAKHKLDKAQSSLKAAEKAGDMKAYTKLLRENPGVAAYGDLQKVQKSISELNKLAVETVNNPAQMKKIDTLRTEQMSVVNKLLKKMEKGEPTLADRLRPGEAATP